MSKEELTEEDVIRYLEECNESQDILGFCYIPEIVCEKILDLYQTEKIGNANLQILLDEEKEKNKELTDEYMIQKHLINTDFLKDYIHKDKIMQKAEEYKEMLKTLNKAEDINTIKAINERLIAFQEILLQEK